MQKTSADTNYSTPHTPHPMPYVIGIDLGTTNSVLAYAPLEGDAATGVAPEFPAISVLPIPQLVAAGTIESRTSLPSFLYLGAAEEAKSGVLDVPWKKKRDFAVGEFARRQAAEVPQRTVVGAKSWLAHHRVDRREPILPWQAPESVPKVSPVEASRRYLEHLIAAWHAAFPEAPIGEQRVVLTVPASFDASSRELTREAALAAGLPENLVLLEEPQAAVYSWLASAGNRWRKLLKVGDILLVCDVGGGTTDLTLVAVTEREGELSLERMAVGNHLLVGGDNMDLALAHHVASLFAAKKTMLDPWQSVSLWHSCRAAKEALLASTGKDTEKQTISVLGRGSKLIGGTVSVEVNRKEVGDLLVDGFLPICKPDERPERRRTSGFQEIGLPFEADTAITRHLAAFLHDHGGEHGAVRPTQLLFNGGVFKSERLRERLVETLAKWAGKKTAPQVLAGEQDLDHAAARGAAYYGWTKERRGVRIRGGAARSYYIGIETSGLAVPGAPRPLRALCVAPFGMEEGTAADVPSGEVGLVVGEPAKFRFFSSLIRKQDRVGDVLPAWSEDELQETDSLEATLPSDDDTLEQYTPVRFHSQITELGMFELRCQSTRGPKSWKLEFSVRDEGE